MGVFVGVQEVKEIICERCGTKNDCDGSEFCPIICEIKSIPALDVVPVVRCENCVNGEFDNSEGSFGACNYLKEWVPRWWFCADGEKKEDRP